MKVVSTLAVFLCVWWVGRAQQVGTVDLPGVPGAEVRTISPEGGYPRIEVRDARQHLLRVVRVSDVRNVRGYVGGPAQTHFKVLGGPNDESGVIFVASGYSGADWCDVSVELLGVGNGRVRPLTLKPFVGDYPEGHFYWGDLGKGRGYGLAHWKHAEGNRFDDRIRLTLYRYDPVRNVLVRSRVMTTRQVVPFGAPNPLAEFGVEYEDLLKDVLPGC